MTHDESSHPGDAPGRRRDPRAGCVLQLQYRNAGHLLVSYCTNLSRGGLFVPSTDPLPPGTRITLSLGVPGETNPVEVAAEVRWVRQFDAAEGPSGMGLSFEDIDDVLGERIDGIVSNFEPLDIALVGNRPPVLKRIAAKLRSLVTCQTSTLALSPDVASVLDDRDLVIVDVDSAPADGLGVLAALAKQNPASPRLALCDGRDLELKAQAIRVARVLPTPVDVEELRASVLETITQVEARASYG